MKQNKTNIVEKNQETTLEFSEQDFLEVKAMVAKSAYCLGRCYETGIGTDKNETEAVRLYNIAAEQGHENAIKSLIVLYGEGAGGFPNNLKRKVYWMNRLDTKGK